MVSDEERLQILKMIEGGQITAEEAAKLLSALEEPSEGEKRREGQPRWFRIRVTDLKTGKRKVNMYFPFKLLDVAARMGAKFATPAGLNIEEMVRTIKEGAKGKIVDVEDDQGAERVEIYVE
jgi:hypothetical protein